MIFFHHCYATSKLLCFKNEVKKLQIELNIRNLLCKVRRKSYEHYAK